MAQDTLAHSDIRWDPTTLAGTPGYFRVGRSTQGVWWLLDAEDRPFLYRGVCGVNRAGTAGGRFAKPGPYAEVVDRKYGYQESAQPFVEATIRRLRDWGFNALGAWATEEFANQGLPYTEILETVKLPGMEPIRTPGIRLPDVFDPVWEVELDRAARALCAPKKDRRDLVGYFTDNELGWGQPGTEAIWGAAELQNQKGPTLLQAILGLPPERPAHQAAWEFVLSRHGSLSGMAAAWEIDLAEREDLLKLNEAGVILHSARYGEDHDAFTRLFAQRYLQLSAGAIRRYDPNHLILGCRFGGPPGRVLLSEFRRPWVDVISANNYRRTLYERTEIYHCANGMPVLNGEFAWASGHFTEPSTMTPQEQARPIEEHLADVGPRTLEEGFRHPALIGYTWYRWVQDPKGSVGYGLVDRQDNPVPLNIRLLSDVHPRLETIAASRENG